MLTNCLAACAHLTITVCEIERDIGRKSSAAMELSRPTCFPLVFVSVCWAYSDFRLYGCCRPASCHAVRGVSERGPTINERPHQVQN